MEKKKSSNKVIIIVVVIVLGGFFVLTCAGVLAAVAIPSFVKYTQKSKAAEASMITRQMADYAQATFMETCAFPPALKRTSEPRDCCGGEKCPGSVDGPWADNVQALKDPNYFSYSAVPDSPTSMYIVANADFDCGGPQHTVELMLVGSGEAPNCSVELQPANIKNELE